MKKRVIFLCLSILLCTSTFAFASLNIQLLEAQSKKIMEFCGTNSCPASSLEDKVNYIVSPVNKAIESIQITSFDHSLIQDRYIEEAILLKQSELLLIDVVEKIDSFITIKSKEQKKDSKNALLF